MARRYDVSARLAEGRDALARTQTYVSACHRLGYRHPELTGYDGQLTDGYEGETGLDLEVLDADCAALNALADAADDALRAHRGQLVELDRSWRGPGGDAATEFLRRHCDTAAQLTARLRAAAAACGTLRDELWRLVDTKVVAVLAVDDRVGAAHPAWLAAARAVNSGTDDAHAAELIDKQVMPYVDTVVRGEWLAAVRSARDGIGAAYRATVAAADPGPGVVFAIPGDLGPPLAAELLIPVATAPVELSAPADWPPANPATAPGAAAAAPAAASPELPADPDPPAGPGLQAGLPGDLGGGLPAGGLGGLSGLGGLIPRLADAFGDPGLGEPFGDRRFDDAVPADPTDADDPEGPDDPDPEAEPVGETAAEADESAAGEAAEEVEPAEKADPDPEAEDTADVQETAGTQEPTADGPPKTPCELAAEELPQVGQ